jgi:hypothetical protein
MKTPENIEMDSDDSEVADEGDIQMAYSDKLCSPIIGGAKNLPVRI